MSFTTGTQTEALSANPAVGSAYSTSTSVIVVSTAASAGFLPANFFLPSYGIAKAILVKAYGVLSTTGTPNLTMAVVAINGWNRLAISFRAVPGAYEPAVASR